MDLRGCLGTEPGNQMNVPALGHRRKQQGLGGWTEVKGYGVCVHVHGGGSEATGTLSLSLP